MKFRLGCSLEQYKKKIDSGEWQLFGFDKGFLVTRVVKYEEEKVVEVLLAGGEQFDAWKSEANERLKQFGIEQGCKALEAVCRLGLEKKLKPLGWRRHRVVMRTDL